MQTSKEKKLKAIYLTMIIGVLAAFIIPPLPQNPEYHNFADQQQVIGISHFWNVISNLPFIIVSLIAVSNLLQKDMLKYPQQLFLCYLVFFVGIGTVGIGSAYYHLQPTNETLFWDRLPMTIAFMSFVSIIIGEYISEKVVLHSLLPLVLMGTASVIYWYFTEQAGQGDLRFYGLVQFLPMLIIPMIILMFPARYTHVLYLWGMLGTYIVAKFFELNDGNLYSLLGIGGHAIKHICAAVGPYLFFLAIKKRSRLYNGCKDIAE